MHPLLKFNLLSVDSTLFFFVLVDINKCKTIPGVMPTTTMFLMFINYIIQRLVMQEKLDIIINIIIIIAVVSALTLNTKGYFVLAPFCLCTCIIIGTV